MTAPGSRDRGPRFSPVILREICNEHTGSDARGTYAPPNPSSNEPFYNSMKAYQSLNVPSNFLQKGYVELEIEYPNSSYDITTAEFKNSNFSLVITDEDNKQVSNNNNIVDFKNLNINVPIKYY